MTTWDFSEFRPMITPAAAERFDAHRIMRQRRGAMMAAE
jgi:hypothetical protein